MPCRTSRSLPKIPLTPQRAIRDRNATPSAFPSKTGDLRSFFARAARSRTGERTGAARRRAASFGSGMVAGLYLVVFGHSLTARFGSGLMFTAGGADRSYGGTSRRRNRFAGPPDTIENPNDRRLPDACRLGRGVRPSWVIGRRSRSDRSRSKPSLRPSCNMRWLWACRWSSWEYPLPARPVWVSPRRTFASVGC